MKPEWNRQVLPRWTKYLFYAFLIFFAIYFLWPWGLSLAWRGWLDNMHRSKRKSQAASLQNSPLFKARFKGGKIIVQEAFSLHIQGGPTKWQEALGVRFLVESRKKTPSGVHYLSVVEILESQRNLTYDPSTMGPPLQDLIDTVESWPGVAEFAENTRCRYGLLTASALPKGFLSVTLSPSLKPKDGLALIHHSATWRNDIHLALTNGKITGAKLPLNKPWTQFPEVAAYDKALMVNGLEPDPDDNLIITPEHKLTGRPKGTKGDEFTASYHGDPNVLGRSWWTAKDATLEKRDQEHVESKLNEAFMRAGLSWEDIQGHLTRTSLSARHEPRWMGGPNGPVDYGKYLLKVGYRYRTERAWIDTLRPGFQLEPILLPNQAAMVQIGELALKPLHRIWLMDEGRAKWILAREGADTAHFTVRLFVTARDQQQKGSICLESRIPKPPPPPLKRGEMRCFWEPYRTLWLDLETGKVTRL